MEAFISDIIPIATPEVTLDYMMQRARELYDGLARKKKGRPR